ncbi:hypothetical protein EKO23_24080 [Nocardioides guangzhouensis]|uniref:Inosine/uridine-preferring nucleoside hydrolase domain-containing protein n=1 Tax=Nocardioides guangzhouensis TaxID=2497878 RepID=A0A4Q4Z2E9_9ACTN|nr:nucleoside hydrolase [Nocardioides guangzhouensis]RYP81061.1 hypothetical protein EKO23_24080 [Nocardioides guangzhouensis]
MRRRLLAVGLTLLATVASGCTAPYDDDGEVTGLMGAAPAKADDAVPVVIDSDLAPDDLAAITYLVRHPRVDVVGITVPATGMVGCTDGLRLLADLFAAIESPSVPVACGTTERGKDGVPFPEEWCTGVVIDPGLPALGAVPWQPLREDAGAFLAQQARVHPGLHVVALGPLTELAALAADRPADYRRIAGVTTMAGAVGDGQDPGRGIGEWNAAADPAAFAAVLAGPVPVTVVPDGPVPQGVPDGLAAAPVVGRLGVDTMITSPAYWDLATAGVFATAGATADERTGAWTAEVTGTRGLLHQGAGSGRVRVVTGLDTHALDASYAAVFGTVDG